MLSVYSNRGQAQCWGLDGSASVNGKQLTITAVNPDAKTSRDTEININGARIASAQARILTATDIHAHNSFANPNALEPRDEAVPLAAAGQLAYRFAHASF